MNSLKLGCLLVVVTAALLGGCKVEQPMTLEPMTLEEYQNTLRPELAVPRTIESLMITTLASRDHWLVGNKICFHWSQKRRSRKHDDRPNVVKVPTELCPYGDFEQDSVYGPWALQEVLNRQSVLTCDRLNSLGNTTVWVFSWYSKKESGTSLWLEELTEPDENLKRRYPLYSSKAECVLAKQQGKTD